MMKENLQKNKGFVALFTVLLASVILAMAVGISNSSLRQILLSASATEANKSFYAADSGIECALFFDRQNPSPFTTGTGAVQCGGETVIIDFPSFGLGHFALGLPGNDGISLVCADVTVDKTIANTTTVTSRGTNIPCGEVSNRRVERVIEVTY
jgi:hypothetical protein